MNVKFYIEGQLVELTAETDIVIRQSVQDVDDITKIKTDFSQKFIAADSASNNKIFRNWHKAEVDNGFDANTRKNAIITLNDALFKEGNVNLIGALIFNGKLKGYSLQFFGALVVLGDLFGEDLLTDLNLSAFAHNQNYNIVSNAIISGRNSGQVIYPLISSESNWLMGAGGLDNLNFSDNSTPNNGMKYSELKPAIKVNTLIQAIRDKYSIQISQDLNVQMMDELFIWASKKEGNDPAVSDEYFYSFSAIATQLTIPLYTDGQGRVKDIVEIRITAAQGFEEVAFTLSSTSVGGINGSKDFKGDGIYAFGFDNPGGAIASDTFNLSIQSSGRFEYSYVIWNHTRSDIAPSDTSVNLIPFTQRTLEANFLFSDEIIGGNKHVGHLPKLKITDLIQGLVKMFNLTVVLDNGVYNFQPLDSWYTQGTTYDLSKFITLGNEPITKPDVTRILEFKYAENEFLLNESYQEMNDKNYGDSISTLNVEAGTTTFETPFKNMLFERLNDQESGEQTELQIGRSLDSKLEPVDGSPLIFMLNGQTQTSFSLLDDSNTKNNMSFYQRVGNDNGTQSINFGSEFSTWSLTEITQGLFSEFYNDYITDLYDIKRRVYKFKGYVPVSFILKIKLNDKLIIDRTRFIINDIQSNLNTGEVTLKLVNDL